VDCLIKGTRITLYNGLSIKIEDMKESNYNLLSWNKHTDQVEISKQTVFKDQGKRPILQITLEDGTILKAGLAHPHLTKYDDGLFWIKTKNLEIGDKLMMNLQGPILNVTKEMSILNPELYTIETKEFDMEYFELILGEYTFNAKTEKNYMKLLAFCRLLGLSITDGHIPKKNNIIVCVDSICDAQIVCKDIKLLDIDFESEYKFEQYQLDKLCGYAIKFPIKLSNAIRALDGIPIGQKVNSYLTMPHIDHWPKPLLREFLGAMFGADGSSPVLTVKKGRRSQLKAIEFSKTKYQSQLKSLEIMLIRMKTMLNIFGIKSSIQKPKQTTSSKQVKHKGEKSFQMNLNINCSDTIKFYERIGFRYCGHKAMRLAVTASYKKLRENTFKQGNWVINRVGELTGYDKSKLKKAKQIQKLLMTIKEAVKIAHKELKQNEPIYNKYYSLPNYDAVRDRLQRPINDDAAINLKFEHFPTPTEYFKKLGCLEWFIPPKLIKKEQKNKKIIASASHKLALAVKPEDTGLPTYALKIIDIKDIGSHQAYDIEVLNTANFVANGVISHNCLITHGIAQFLKEIMLEKSDIYKTYVCDICGLFAQKILDREVWYCPACPSTTNNGKNNTRISSVVIPYAFKLLLQELMALHIAGRIEPKKTLYNQGII
jgi:intein/homing endonuclease/ribosomal protein L37AE/L43A